MNQTRLSQQRIIRTTPMLMGLGLLCAVMIGLSGGAVLAGRLLSHSNELVFVQRNPEKGDIYALDIDRRLTTNLTRHPERDLDPAWSPDGSQLAFVSYRGSPFPVIYVMDADGRNVRRVSGAGSTSPAWSPDGSRLAFVVEGHIYVMAADGTQVEQLTFQFLTHHSPVWSPDGREVAFVSWRNATAGMYALDIETRQVRRLSYVGGSPDWGGVATSGAATSEAATSEAATSEAATSEAATSEVSISSAADSGTTTGQIVFEHTRGSNTNLYVLSGDALTPAQALTDSRHNIDPAWSPDDTQIAYVTLREDGISYLCLMAVLNDQPFSTGSPQCLFADQRVITQPAWRP